MKNFIIFVVLIPQYIMAFSVIYQAPYRYQSSEIQVYIDFKSCSDTRLKRNELEELLDIVLEQTWNAHPNESSLNLKYSGEVDYQFDRQDSTSVLYNKKANPLDENTILMGCADESFDESLSSFSVFGIGNIRCLKAEGASQCRGFVAINKSDRSLSYEELPPRGKAFFKFLLAHELGHALGLAHSDQLGGLMAAGGFGYDYTTLQLKQDDIAGIKTLFPRVLDSHFQGEE